MQEFLIDLKSYIDSINSDKSITYNWIGSGFTLYSSIERIDNSHLYDSLINFLKHYKIKYHLSVGFYTCMVLIDDLSEYKKIKRLDRLKQLYEY
jgi:hypothetical protein